MYYGRGLTQIFRIKLNTISWLKMKIEVNADLKNLWEKKEKNVLVW